MNLTLIAALIAGAAGFSAAWQWQDYRQTEQEAARERIQFTQARSTFKALEAESARVITAQAQAAARMAALRGDLVRVGAAADGVRSAADDALREANANPAACTEHAATLNTVFAECRAALVQVATDAAGWQSEAVMQHDAATR